MDVCWFLVHPCIHPSINQLRLEVRQDNKTCLKRSFVSKIYDQLGRSRITNLCIEEMSFKPVINKKSKVLHFFLGNSWRCCIYKNVV